MDEQPLGALLDDLGIAYDLAEGELVSGAVVLLKIVLPDGRQRLALRCSEGMDWMSKVGMLRVAERMESDTTGAIGD